MTSHGQLSSKLDGVVSIPVTPFDSRNRIDQQRFAELMGHQQQCGIRTFVPCGNTGEFYSLQVSECEALFALATSCRQSSSSIIAGVGHDLETASYMAVMAERAGCDGVMVHMPPHPFLSSAGYEVYVRSIANAVGIAVVPYVRDDRVDDLTLLRLSEIDNVIAIKYAVPDGHRLGRLLARTDNTLLWINGLAEAWAPFFSGVGVTAFTSGLANVSPQLSMAMHAAVTREDSVAMRHVWRQIQPFETLRAEHKSAKNVSVVKEGMHLLGHCERYVRSPLTELNPHDKEKVREMVDSWGLELVR